MDESMTAPRTGPAPADWVPVDACTLPTPEQPLRVAEFDDLFAECLRAVEHPDGSHVRARLVLAGDDGLAGRVQRLAAAESACCSFFGFTLAPLDRGTATESEHVVALDIEVPAGRADVLTALVRRAEQTLRAEG